MDKEIILSVIIPTYNRVNFLETTVNCFISQITAGGFKNDVELVIGNDASPDKTREYLEKLKALYPFVKTFTNAENLGLSGNVEKLVDTANANFIWLFGEDDLITPLSLKRVLESIKTDNPNIIVFNTVNMISLDDRNLEYKIPGENRLALKNDVFVESFEADKSKLLSIKNWLYLTNLVSASAFKKDLFLANLPLAKKYVRSENVYLFQAPLIIGIAKQGRLKIIAQRSVLHRKNETHWSKTIHGNFRVSLYDGSEIVRLIKDYIPSEYKAYEKIFAVQTFTAVRKGKELGVNVTKCILDAIKKYYDCFPYSIRFFLALLTPVIIFKLSKKLWPKRSI
ncbi:MAG: hypothetical protein A3J62_02465 [Candidatus Buchananbacteria bacterium RIFCSPHIGHO2_02_FULL_38_8]|uniref:Glycosyltransferase 2-like domain-containing protein n=1 Tax=Candidatus Buchananbacteria bacterium RIFCSPHIGHO2_02_FULL_38_8 TaxID=1797538 RepID=A0A1G1Y4H1_9BACT|nr:MAG: hypothetical protein A3J62_02465 [Candidatus Buchananbacteria bacterium RIFCSPHIGHO2_02_FULL_38_8]